MVFVNSMPSHLLQLGFLHYENIVISKSEYDTVQKKTRDKLIGNCLVSMK